MNFGATIQDAEGLRLSAEEKAFFRDSDPFGFILFARNIESADQVRALCDEMREAVGRDAVICIDQEGGRVQRLRPPLARQWFPPLDQAKRSGEWADMSIYFRYLLIAQELRGLGIDCNCAPMADIAGPDTHEFLRNRCFGDDPDTVASLARVAADGLLDGGVLPVVKHMPGHGRAVVDSHFEVPRVTADGPTLSETDFAPFHALRDLPLGMTGHVVYESIDDRPATLSPMVMELVREMIGFGGLIMTDDISMKALKGSVGEIAAAAIAAGCDVVLHCNGTLEARQEVAEAAGTLSEAGQSRAEAAMAWRRTPDPLDIDAIEDHLRRLMGGQVYDG